MPFPPLSHVPQARALGMSASCLESSLLLPSFKINLLDTSALRPTSLLPSAINTSLFQTPVFLWLQYSAHFFLCIIILPLFRWVKFLWNHLSSHLVLVNLHYYVIKNRLGDTTPLGIVVNIFSEKTKEGRPNLNVDSTTSWAVFENVEMREKKGGQLSTRIFIFLCFLAGTATSYSCCHSCEPLLIPTTMASSLPWWTIPKPWVKTDPFSLNLLLVGYLVIKIITSTLDTDF